MIAALPFYSPEVLQAVIELYLGGVAVFDICTYTGLGNEDINKILDVFAPCLG